MALDLKKKVELVGLQLKKNNVADDVVARVVMVNDGSGSMEGLYKDGTMQELNDRAMALAVRFDDDGSLEQYVFSNSFKKLPDATANMFGSYVNRYLVPACQWGGTDAAPVMQAIVDSYMGSSPAEQVVEKAKGFFSKIFGTKAPTPIEKPVVNPKDTDPMFVLFQTDGEFTDKDAVQALMEKYSGLSVYWSFVGVGNSSFRFLNQLSDKYPNVSFSPIEDLSKVSDEDLYALLLDSKFCSWISSKS